MEEEITGLAEGREGEEEQGVGGEGEQQGVGEREEYLDTENSEASTSGVQFRKPGRGGRNIRKRSQEEED